MLNFNTTGALSIILNGALIDVTEVRFNGTIVFQSSMTPVVNSFSIDEEKEVQAQITIELA